MKQGIKKLLILLLTILLTKTTSFSSTISKEIEKDSIVSITPIQLKETNLIFAEHQKLLNENRLLFEQINNYEEDNKLLMQSDSIRQVQIQTYKNLNETLNKNIDKKNKALFFWKVGGITVSSGLLIFLLLK